MEDRFVTRSPSLTANRSTEETLDHICTVDFDPPKQVDMGLEIARLNESIVPPLESVGRRRRTRRIRIKNVRLTQEP